MSKLTSDQAQAFAALLYKQSGPAGRANLAALRHAAVDLNHDFRDLPILAAVLADDNQVFDAQRLVAGLFALYAARFWNPQGRLQLPHFGEKARYSFGASLRLLRNHLSGGQDSLDLRFNALLNTPAEDLTVPLRGLMQRLATAERPVPVDFGRLLLDVVRWEYEPLSYPSVGRSWARDYWQFSANTSEAESLASTDSETI